MTYICRAPTIESVMDDLDGLDGRYDGKYGDVSLEDSTAFNCLAVKKLMQSMQGCGCEALVPVIVSPTGRVSFVDCYEIMNKLAYLTDIAWRIPVWRYQLTLRRMKAGLINKRQCLRVPTTKEYYTHLVVDRMIKSLLSGAVCACSPNYEILADISKCELAEFDMKAVEWMAKNPGTGFRKLRTYEGLFRLLKGVGNTFGFSTSMFRSPCHTKSSNKTKWNLDNTI